MIYSLTQQDTLWDTLIEHLHRHRMARWVIDPDGRAFENTYYLAAVEEGVAIGHITLLRQQLQVPETNWSMEQSLDPVVEHPSGQTLYEMFVQTFAVDKEFRRQGIGRALQETALQTTLEMGAYQLRSWSSLDHPENYALKLKLGFCIHPTTQRLPDGSEISGAFFVKRV